MAREVNWVAIEVAFRTTDASVRKIARDFGVAESTIRDRAERQGWERGTPAQSAQPESRICAHAQSDREDGGLTPMQQAFVREYLVNLNASAAARRAGYSEASAGQQGYQLLQIPSIQVAIQAAMDQRAARTEITADRVLAELADLAFYDPADIAGQSIACPADIAKLPANVRRAIIGWGWDKHGNFTLKLSPKVPSLDLIGKHLGMFVNRTEVTGDAGGPIEVKNDAITETRRLLERLVAGKAGGHVG